MKSFCRGLHLETERTLLSAIERGFVSGHLLPPRLEALSRLPTSLRAHSRDSRAGITNSFEKYWRGTEGWAYVVTTGYSETVLGVMRWLLNESVPAARLFFLADTDKERLSARLMRTSLGPKPAASASWVSVGPRVAAGSSDMFLGLLGSGDSVLILLGVECFDSRARVVHPHYTTEVLSRFINKIGLREARKIEVLGVAEEYKLVEDLAESGFYSDHLDGVAVLNDEIVKGVMTEVTIYRPPPSPSSEKILGRKRPRSKPAASKILTKHP